MEDFFDLDKVKAKVFLLADNDTRNMAMVTDEKLMLIRNGKKRIFPLSLIKSLATSHKKLLFPLFVGAVIAPFAFSSYFTNLFHPIIHLLSTLLGLLLFYIGWAGKPVLILVLAKEEDFIFLPTISKNLLGFIDYVNTLLRSSNQSDQLIFIESKADNHEWLFKKGPTSKNDFPVFAYTLQQLRKVPSLKGRFIVIDPRLAGREIKFEADPSTQQMRPKIDGPIHENAKINISDSEILTKLADHR